MGFKQVHTRMIGRARALLVPALLLIAVAGCAGDAKADRAVTAYDPQPADEQTQVSMSSEQTAQQEPPAGTSDDKPGQVQADQPPRGQPPMDEAQRQALEDMIRKAITEEIARGAAEKKPPADAGQAQAAPARQTPTSPGKTAAVNTAANRPQDAAAAKKGCGATQSGTRVDLTPPPPEQPQPKFVCDQTKIVSKPLWQGGKAEFTFKVRNTGAGALALRLKGG